MNRDIRFNTEEECIKSMHICNNGYGFLLKSPILLIKCIIMDNDQHLFIEYFEYDDEQWIMKHCYICKMEDSIEKLLYMVKEFRK